MGEVSRCFTTYGKGDAPRNCFSREFHKNYDQIKWDKKTKSKNGKIKIKYKNK